MGPVGVVPVMEGAREGVGSAVEGGEAVGVDGDGSTGSCAWTVVVVMARMARMVTRRVNSKECLERAASMMWDGV